MSCASFIPHIHHVHSWTVDCKPGLIIWSWVQNLHHHETTICVVFICKRQIKPHPTVTESPQHLLIFGQLTQDNKPAWTGHTKAASVSECLIAATSEGCVRLFRCVCIALSLWGFSLHLEAVPVVGVFLCQGCGRGDEVTERQQRERGGRRKTLKKRLRGRRGESFNDWNV